jgi:hypothetical protein
MPSLDKKEKHHQKLKSSLLLSIFSQAQEDGERAVRRYVF